MAETKTNTNSVNDVLLDRENDEARKQSVRREWNALQHMLHLPRIEDLGNGEINVHESITNLIFDVRGALSNRAQINAEVLRSYTLESQRVGDAVAPDRSINIAQAWLNVIHANLTEEDIRGLIQNLPAAIQTLRTNPRNWITNNPVTFAGPPPCTGLVRIDLDHPVWAHGSRQEITARLLDQRPDRVGIRFMAALTPVGRTLNAQDIDAIFTATDDVIDPRLSLRPIEYNISANRRLSLDLPTLVRDNPDFAGFNRTQLDAHLQAMIGPDLDAYCAVIDRRTGNRVPITLAIASDIAQEVFTQLNLRSNNRLLARRVTLDNAIAARQPIDRLLSTSADNRELMIALATIQRDPTAASAIPQDQTARIQGDIQQNLQNLRTAQIIKNVEQLPLSEYTLEQIEESEDVLNDIAARASGGPGLPNGARVHIIHSPAHRPITTRRGVALTQVQANAIAARFGIRRESIHRSITVDVRNGTRENSAEFQAIIDLTVKGQEKLDESRNRLNNIRTNLDQLINSITENGFRDGTTIPNATYPLINRFLVQPPVRIPFVPGPIAPGTLAVQADQIDRNINLNALTAEVRLLLRNRQPRLDLRDVDFYQKRQEELEKQQRDNAEAGNQGLNGSEACWAVIRQGLINQGIRGPELEKTLMEMRNRVQASPESIRDRASLVDAAFPWDGEDETDRHNLEHWNHGREGRAISTGQTLRNNMPLIGASILSTAGAIVAGGAAGSALVLTGAAIPAGIAALYLGYRRLTGERFNAVQTYIDRLLPRTPDAHGHHGEDHGAPPFGIHIDDNPMHPSIRIPTLVRAYFGMKRLMALPEDNPRRVPETRQVVTFMRNIHRAILERTQLSFNNAAGMSQADMVQIHADGLKVEPAQLSAMTPIERMQRVQNYLINGFEDFADSNGGRYLKAIDQQSTVIYRHIDEGVQQYNKGRANRSAALKKYAYQNEFVSAAGVVNKSALLIKNVYWDAPKYVVKNTIIKPVKGAFSLLKKGALTFMGLSPSSGGHAGGHGGGH